MLIKLQIYIFWLTLFTSTSLADLVIKTTPNVMFLNHNNNINIPTISVDQKNELQQLQQRQHQVEASPLMALPYNKRPSLNKFFKHNNNIMSPLAAAAAAGVIAATTTTTTTTATADDKLKKNHTILSQNQQNNDFLYKNNYFTKENNKLTTSYLPQSMLPYLLSPVTTIPMTTVIPVKKQQQRSTSTIVMDSNRFRRNSEDLLAAVKPLGANIKSVSDIITACQPNYLHDERVNGEYFLPSSHYNLPLMKRKNCLNNLCQEEANKKLITFWDFIRKFVHSMTPPPLKYESLAKIIPSTSDLVWTTRKTAAGTNIDRSNKYGPLSEEYSGMQIWNSVNLSGKRERPLYVDEPQYVIVRRENEYSPQIGFDGTQIPFLPPRGRKDNQDLTLNNRDNTISIDKSDDRYDLFIPNRGKKRNTLHISGIEKRTNFNDIFDEQDLFVPNRGKKLMKNYVNLAKRYTILDDLKGDLFIPNRGKKKSTELIKTASKTATQPFTNYITNDEMKNEKRNALSSKTMNKIFQLNKKISDINYKTIKKWPTFDDLDIGDLFYPNRGKRSISANNLFENFYTKSDNNNKNNLNKIYDKHTDEDGRLDKNSHQRMLQTTERIYSEPIVTEETFDKQQINNQQIYDEQQQQLVNDYYYYY